MGRRGRRQQKRALAAAPPRPADSEYTDADGNVLTLRSSLTAASRRDYERALVGAPLSREDAWQRAFELLFERLAVRWVIAGLPIDRQRELLARLRMASPQERRWVRAVLREHCAEHFPDVRAP